MQTYSPNSANYRTNSVINMRGWKRAHKSEKKLKGTILEDNTNDFTAEQLHIYCSEVGLSGIRLNDVDTSSSFNQMSDSSTKSTRKVRNIDAILSHISHVSHLRRQKTEKGSAWSNAPRRFKTRLVNCSELTVLAPVRTAHLASWLFNAARCPQEMRS